MFSIAILAVLLAAPAWADPIAERAFDHFYNLEYDDALAGFRQEIAENPQDAAAYNHLAQTILYRALYRSGQLEESLIAGEDPLLSVIRQPKLALSAADDGEFTGAIQRAMLLSRQRLEDNPNDTHAMYVLGAAHGLRANYKFLVRKAWLSALRDANAGLRLHKQVLERDPGNVDAKLLTGVHDYVVAKLPTGLRMLGAVAGIRGDKERGLATIAGVAEHGITNRTDARILLATLLRHEKRPREAAVLLNGLSASYPRNHLLLLAGTMTLLDDGDAVAARRLLPVLSRAWHRADAAGAAQRVLFTQGLIEMRSGELDRALATFAKAGGVKAMVYSGHIHDLKGERDAAVRAYKAAMSIAPNTRCSRRSERFLAKPYRPHEGD